jgi:hypothetical protein
MAALSCSTGMRSMMSERPCCTALDCRAMARSSMLAAAHQPNAPSTVTKTVANAKDR